MRRESPPVALVISAIVGLSQIGEVGAGTPWWDDFPALVQGGDAAMAARCHATAAMCGAADDPTWGTYAQRLRISGGRQHVDQLHAAGVRALTWIEAFGTAHAYIAQFKRNQGGGWIGFKGEPESPRPFATHYAWQTYDGTGEIRWIGIQNFYDCDDIAGPYNRLHPRYGAPPMRYPDGRLAAGPADEFSDPRKRRVFDAGCSKDVLGRIAFDYDSSEQVNRIDPATGRPRGPLDGLLETGEPPPRVPDPGFTPEQWEKLKAPRRAGCISPGKDSACPLWIDYARASVRQALDAGIDGLWIDNFSPWDSLNAAPVRHAFGDWSVAGFREYLAKKGIQPTSVPGHREDAATFDVREHLKARVKQWGGDPTDLRDRRWRDPGWEDDPIWGAYLIYKRETGAEALSRLYRAIKEEAIAAGKPDFLVSGNDIPNFSLGWVRGDLDMVSTELSWDWGLASGPRGLMPPPLGRYAPVYLLAREHAKGRFVNAWMYVPEERRGKPNIARVLYYEALANHAGPMPLYSRGSRTCGTEEADADFFEFMRHAAPVFGRREPIADVGIYYSSSSQMRELLPGGFRDHADQPHIFSFWGWGTALTYLHVPWRAVPDWKLTDEMLRGLTVLVIPSSEVFATADAGLLGKWVDSGGRLIIAGRCGVWAEMGGTFTRLAKGSTLDGLGGAARGPARGSPAHRGVVLELRKDPGLAFYKAGNERPEMAGAIRAALEGLGTPLGRFPLAAADTPWDVGLTPHRAPGRLFVDANNTRIDIEADRVVTAPAVRFAVALPDDLRGRALRARVLCPDHPPAVALRQRGADRVEISLGGFDVYASVVIEADDPADAGAR